MGIDWHMNISITFFDILPNVKCEHVADGI